MNDLPSWVLPLVTLLIGPGGFIISFLALRKDVKKGPVTKEEAAQSNAIAMSDMANSLLKTVTDRLKNVTDRVDAQDKKIDEQRILIEEQDTKIHALQDRLDDSLRLLGIWGEWYEDLNSHWPIYKNNPNPPTRPKE